MNIFKHYGTRIFISLVLSVPFLLQVAGTIDWRFFRTMESYAYDTRLKLALPNTVDPRIVIVDVDEKSLAVEGRWPWSRDKMATLVNNLFESYQISAVGFDMVFAEREEHEVFEELAERARHHGDLELAEEIALMNPQTDLKFARALEDRKVTLGYYFSGNGNTAGKLPEAYLPGIIAQEMDIPAYQTNGYGANLEMFQNATKSGGFFDNPLSDEDGVFRRAPMLQTYQGDIFESLSLSLVQSHLNQPLSIGDKNEWLYIGDHAIPVDGSMAALVPYRGLQGSFPYVSATDVLSGGVQDASVLRDAIILVGTTAPGLYDLRSTPVQKVYAGVEIHANIISGILDNRFLSRPSYTAAAELIALALIALLLAIILPMLGAVGSTLLGVGALTMIVASNVYLWSYKSVVVSVAPALLLVMALYLFNMVYGFIMESKSRRALTRRFGQYVPPELVKEMSANPEQYSMSGERREMTVLFSDVRGFSNLSENMDPAQLSELMNELLTALTRVIYNHRGTVDKYMGDAVMAFWGAPLNDPDHASGAVAAALNMTEAIEKAQQRFMEKGWPEIRMGIGINTGPMNVGDMGSEYRMAYTVMGDAVNVGSRLEGLTRIYGVNVIVSESTKAAAEGYN